MRIAFCGTPDFAVPSLQMLIDEGHELALFTNPDKPKGRKGELTPPPTKVLAEKHGIPVYQFEKIRRPEGVEALRAFAPDLMVTAAFGQILSAENLSIPKYGCINVHGSLLPKYRGAAPIQWSIIEGEKITGVTTMLTDVGLDTGDMLYKAECDITSEDTSASLYEKLAGIGPQALLHTLSLVCQNALRPEKQDDSLVTYAEKLSKEEARLDWSLSAAQLDRCIRAFNPWPLSYMVIDEQPVKVWQANAIAEQTSAAPGTVIRADKNGIQVATAEGILNITQLQPAGKKPMSAADILNSRKEWFTPGNSL